MITKDDLLFLAKEYGIPVNNSTNLVFTTTRYFEFTENGEIVDTMQHRDGLGRPYMGFSEALNILCVYNQSGQRIDITMDLSQNNPTYPKLDRIRNITGKLAELWSMKPGITFMALIEDVVGQCIKDQCVRSLDDETFEYLIDAMLVELLGK